MDQYHNRGIFVGWCWLVVVTVVSTGSGIIGKSSGCPDEERMGLLEIKAALHSHVMSLGDDTDLLPSWRSDSLDCCSWERVHCDKISSDTGDAMRVTQLQLQAENAREIVGVRPWLMNATLFHPFQELQVLTFNRRPLAGFKGILKLKKLRFLDLTGNELTEVPSLKGLPSLIVANFSLNFNLRNLSNLEGAKLEALDVSSLNASGDTLSAIWSLASLKSLEISGNRLNNTSSGFCELTSLEELYIRWNELGPEIPLCLGNMTAIRVLNLGSNHLRGTVPGSLFTSLTSLEWISLNGNAFGGSFALASIANSSRLEVFDLRGNANNNSNPLKVKTEDPLYSPRSQFKYFQLSNCIVNNRRGGVIPSFLSEQHDLRVLLLTGTDLKGDFPTWLLENNTKPELLVLRKNSFSGRFNLNSSSIRSRLWGIDMSFNDIQGEIPSFISSVFPNLQSLSMSGNHIQGRIPPAMSNMRSLRYLDLSHNNLTGELPESLITECLDLWSLRVSHNALHGQFLPRKYYS